MNPIFETRKNRGYFLGKIEITPQVLEKGYRWIVAQMLTHEVYADQISPTLRIARARDFLLNHFNSPEFVVLKPIKEVRRGRERKMYVLPENLIAGFILRYGIDVVCALYNAKEIDVAKKTRV